MGVGLAHGSSAAVPPVPMILLPSWVNVTASVGVAPPATSGSSLAYDVADNETVWFGGATANQSETNWTWVFEDGVWTNVTNPPDAPPARAYASMDYDANMGGVLLFGGTGVNGQLDDTWLFAGGTWTNLTYVSVPPPVRDGAMMAFDPQPDENGSVLFGGLGASVTLNDTWIWESWSGWVRANSSLAPPPVELGGLAYDTASGYLVQYGGVIVCGFLCFGFEGQTWEFYSGEWWPVAPTSSPGNLTEFSMGYAPSLGGVLLFGGFDGTNILGETWEFHSGDWFERSPTSSPSPRALAAAAVDSGPIAPVLESGTGVGNPYPDTWVYGYTPQISVTGPSATESGAPSTFTVSPERGSAPYTARVSFGDGSSTVVTGPGPFSISHTYPAPGSYSVDANVTDAVGAVANLAPILSITVTGGPSVTAVASPTATDLGHPVHLNASATSGASPYTFGWSFGDSGNGTGASASHSYASAGAHTATVVATDSSGGVANASVLIHVNPLPTVTGIRSGKGATAGSPDPFSANVSGGTAPYTYSWSFGDGATGASATPSHSFAQAGTYTVNLWVNDSVGGSAHDIVTVEVAPAPSSSPGTSSSSTAGIPTWFWAVLVVLVVVAAALAVLAMRKRPS